MRYLGCLVVSVGAGLFLYDAGSGPAAAGAAQKPPPKYKPIDAKTITAFEKIGGKHGGLDDGTDEYRVGFNGGDRNDPHNIPGFEFRDLQPGKFPELPGVSVPFALSFSFVAGDKSLTETDMKRIAKAKNLIGLNLFRVNVAANDLRLVFKEQKSLTVLSIQKSDVTDAVLGDIKELKSLVTLEIQYPVDHKKITSDGLKQITALKNLVSLDLTGVYPTDAAMKHLKELKNLTQLEVIYSELTDDGANSIGELKNLVYLNLAAAKFGDDGLKPLGRLKNLKSLNLGSTEITDAGLRHLVGLNNLKELIINGTAITDEGLKTLAGFKQLTKLDLGATKTTPEGVKALRAALPKCKVRD